MTWKKRKESQDCQKLRSTNLKIAIYNSQRLLKIPRDLIRKVCMEVAKNEGESFDELSLHFVTPKKISELHGEFFNDPTPTDCITFPLDGKDEADYRVLGDIFICPKVAEDYILAHGGDLLDETILYVIHGLLHLFGYDDMNSKDRKIMKLREKYHQNKIRPWLT